MLRHFQPDLYVNSIYDLNLDSLWERGIRGIITDLDNTLIPWSADDAPEKLFSWMNDARQKGFRFCIVSNNTSERVQGFAEKFKIPALGAATKPRRGGFRRAIELLGTRPEETAVLGDQVFTDILGGNRLGLFTILVVPMSKEEFLGTRIIRLFERRLLRLMKRRGLLE